MAVIRELDRQIAARVRKVRYANQLSQPEFAKRLGLTVDQEANIEYCRTPLTVEVADQISSEFDVSLIWLSQGTGRMNPTSGLIRIFAPEIESKSALSKVWSATIEKKLREGTGFRWFAMEAVFSKGEAPVSKEQCARYFEEFLRDAAEIFHDLDHAHRERLLNAFACALAPISVESFLHKENSSIEATHRNLLTAVHASVKSSEVKPQWPLLKQRLQKATSEPGSKSKLAEFLQVKLASVSQWLTDKKTSAREPGAETALRMLYWVERQERK